MLSHSDMSTPNTDNISSAACKVAMPEGWPDLDWPQVCHGRIDFEHRQVLFSIDADYPGRVTHSGA